MSLPPTADLFGDDDPVGVTNRFEAYKTELNKALENPKAPPMGTGGQLMSNPLDAFSTQLASPEVSKALSPEVLSSVQQQLATSSMNKDITIGNSPFGGVPLVAIDLEAPAKLLAPRPTPLRNRIPRRQGMGTAHQYRVITGFTGTGTGGVGLIRPGITENTTTAFGSVNYLRGPKIQYNGFSAAVPYLQFSVSDQVSWAAQFSGRGFEDMRQLSQTSVLYSSMLLEEREILGGRGTAAGFGGGLTTPTITLTVRAAAGGEAALPNSTTVWVKAASQTMWGSTPLSSAVSASTTATGQVIDVTVGNPGGGTAFQVYAGTGASNPGDGALWAVGQPSGSSVVTLTGPLPTSGVAASTVNVADSTGAAGDYDGILSYCTGPQSGYVGRINGPLSTANPGDEFFKALASMYDSVKADPDTILANGNDRKQLSDVLKTASTTGYRIMVNADRGQDGVHDATLGALVSGLQNEVTGKMLDIMVHPWMPQGIMPIISWTLPLPDSNVSDVWAIYNVQDYMAINWPVTQFAYETSSYWYGTLICYAPAWNGAIVGVKKA